MNEQEIAENRVEYHRELRYWQAHIEEWTRSLKRARAAKTIEHCQEKITLGHQEIERNHRTWLLVTGLEPEREQTLWSQATER